MKISELDYHSFEELVVFLKSISEDTISTFYKFSRFFIELNKFQSLGLLSILNNTNEDDFNNFIKMYPDLEFDPEGKQPVKTKFDSDSTEILDVLYNDIILRDTNSGYGKVIREAKELTNILKIESTGCYSTKKFLYLRKANDKNIESAIENLESIANDLFGKDSWKLLIRVIKYIESRPNDRSMCFLKHFTIRLKNCGNSKNRDYIEKLNKIVS